jgi:type IV secretion system protein VirB4
MIDWSAILCVKLFLILKKDWCALKLFADPFPKFETSDREVTAGKHLPYSRHVNDCTIETHDGLLMQCIRVDGLLFETADTDELNYRKKLRDGMLQAIGTSQYAVYHHVIRREVDPELGGAYHDDFSKTLDAAWQGRLASKRLYINELYLTLVRRPAQGRVGLLDQAMRFLGRQRGAGEAQMQELRQLDSARDALMASLGSYSPQLLGIYEGLGGLYSQPLEFLSRLYNCQSQPVRLPMQDLGDYLPARRISFGQQTIELAETGLSPRQFSSMVAIKDYNGQTSAGMFDELLRMPFEFTLTQSFGFTDRQAALGRMNLALRRMRSAEDEAVSLRNELSLAKDEVAAGRAGFGEHHMTLAIHGNTQEDVNSGTAEIIASLADLGIVSVREEIALEPSFWAQFPGNFKYIPRRGMISTSNFAGLASLHNFPVGQPSGNHWGEAVTLFETTAAGPYYFNFHQGDLGNFTVIGPSGSGKTVVLNFLLAQARKFSPRIVFFDKDRGAELFIRAIGGRYDVLRPGTVSGLNPLQMADTPSNRQFLIEWLVQLAGGANIEELEQIREAVEINFSQPLVHRQLKHLVALFRGGHRPHERDLYARLVSWWGNGEKAWLFDNIKDQTDVMAESIGFDMTELLDNPVLRTPAMMYLFHRVEERLDGSAAIIVVDEGWKALDDEVFVRKIKDWEKTIRKRNGIVGFATQSAQDALESKIASAIIEQAATQIFMANSKARAQDYMDGFGLSEHEYELVRSLPDSARCFLIKHGNESVVARLNLTGQSDILTILSGREANIRLLDAIRDEVGDAPSAWMPKLFERLDS